MTFSFSLCVVSLLTTIVAYFETKLGNLADKKPLEGGKVYHVTNLSSKS